jgi:hypothetical protein
VAVLYRHVHEEIPPLRSVSADVDERIERWVARLLAKDPVDRYPTADEAWLTLEDVILDLLGPRWRRDARLAVDETPTVDRAPLAPAPFTPAPVAGTDHEPGRLAARHRDTEEPLPVIAETAGGVETVAPSSRPRPSYTTILRPARRHRDPGPDAGAAERNPWRRRVAVLGILAAMAGAALAGVLLAAPHGPAEPTRAEQHTAQRTAARTEVRRQDGVGRTVITDGNNSLATIMRSFAPRYNRDYTRLVNTHTPTAQIDAAEAEQKDFAGAARRVSAFTAQTPKAAPLAATLRAVAAAYGRFAAAVRAGDSPRFAAAEKGITSGSKTLEHQVAGL